MKAGSGPRTPDPTSRAILLSKRANAFLIERARVMQKDGRLLFLTQRGEEIEQFFNIPYKNTAFLLLGLGTSITESAVRLLAESGVMVGFVGTGGSPLLGAWSGCCIACRFREPRPGGGASGRPSNSPRDFSE